MQYELQKRRYKKTVQNKCRLSMKVDWKLVLAGKKEIFLQ